MDVTELKEKIVITGAEVNTQLIVSSSTTKHTKSLKIFHESSVQTICAGWAEQLHLG